MGRYKCFLLLGDDSPDGRGKLWTPEGGAVVCTYRDWRNSPSIRGRSFSPICKRADTGEEMTLSEAPIGAMLDVGFGLHVKVPNGEQWHLDNRDKNCKWPFYDGTVHRCYIRRGVPPDITIEYADCEVGLGKCGVVLGFDGNTWRGTLVDGYLQDG